MSKPIARLLAVIAFALALGLTAADARTVKWARSGDSLTLDFTDDAWALYAARLAAPLLDGDDARLELAWRARESRALARAAALGFLPAFRFTFDTAAVVCAAATLLALLPARERAARRAGLEA